MRCFIALGCAFVLLLGACGQPAASTEGAVVPQLAVSELVVGPNRLALGLIQDGSPLNDPNAKVHLRFYDRSDTSAAVKGEVDAKYYGQGLPAAVYVAYPIFQRAGEWEVVVETQLSNQSAPSSSRLRFLVQESTASPKVGQAAISVQTPTAETTPSDQLSSGGNPNLNLYQISLDQALQSGKPTALLFATPAYCKTAVCGPSVNVLGDLQQQFGDRVNFIHAEVYQYPFADSFKNTVFSDAMSAWKLSSEPWLFLIGKDGIIKARYEGGITVEELTPDLQNLASS